MRVHVGDLGIIDPDDPAHGLTYTTLAAANKFLRDIASKRSREAVNDRKAKGLPIGLPPYGHLPGEDLQRVLAALDQGGSYHEAARILNRKPGHLPARPTGRHPRAARPAAEG